MKRGIDAATLAALQGNFHPVLAVEIDWPDGMVRMHTGVGDLVWGGNTFKGVSIPTLGGIESFGTLSVPQEGGGLAASTATLRLVGLPEEIQARLDDPIRNREGRVYLGCTTERAGNTLVGDLAEMFFGYIDAATYVVEVAGEDGALQIVHGAEVTLGTGPSARATASMYHSYEDQLAAYAGDTAGRHLQYARQYLTVRTWPET